VPSLKLDLTDKSVGRLPFAENQSYRVFDDSLPGFFVMVGKRRKSFLMQGDHWKNGVREFSCRITLGHHPD